MSKIIVKSPTRVDLAGGTLDCWPLNAIVGKCYTINLSISIYTEAQLEPRSDKQINLDIADLNYQKSFANLQELLTCSDPELVLVASHLKYWQPELGFSLRTSSQSPVGGGLGGSSSLSVSIIKAFSQWLERPMSGDEIVRLAANVEAHFLNTPTGTQDYIGAYSHGLNSITYDYSGIEFELLDFDQQYFEDHLLVVYTGKSHHSGINNWQVIKEVVEKNENTLAALHVKKDWSKIPELLNQENDMRVKLSSGFTNPEIEDLKSISFANGALGFKICGAGGGGCVMIWAPKNSHEGIKQACQKKNYQVLKVNLVTQQA